MNTQRQIIVGLLVAAGLCFIVGGKGCNLGGIIAAPPPFKTDKLAVVIVEETAARGSLSAGQRAAILSTKTGSLIDTVKTRGGSIRILDKDQTSFANDPPWVAAAFAVPHPTLPWIVAAGPASGISQALPETIEETQKLVEGAK